MAGTKTTVAIDDDLLRMVRERTGQEDRPVAELIESALQRFVATLAPPVDDGAWLATFKAEAALEGRSEDDVTANDVDRYQEDLVALEATFRQLQARGPNLPEDEGLELTYEELRAERAERAQRVEPG